MKLITQLFPYVIIAILMYLLISRPTLTEYVEVPAKTGEFEVVNPQPIVQYDTIYKDSIIEKLVVRENPINQELLKKYTVAKDSLEQAKLYKDAITTRDYKQIFKDAHQEITIYSQVTGTLNRQEVDYSIGNTQVKFKSPSEGLYVGVGLTTSYRYLELPTIDVNLSYLKNKRIYTIGVGSDETIKAGIKQKIF